MTTVDRIIELDIDSLGTPGSPSKVADVVARLVPLWRDASESEGTVGIVLNLGWLMDPVVLFTGDESQTLPIRSKRLAPFAAMTYAELGELITQVRLSARAQGIPELRIGMLLLGIGEFVNEIVRAPGTGTEDTEEAALYQESGEWFARHPELFPFSSEVTLHGPGLDWRVPLDSDSRRYASRPDGIASGEIFGEFFADQWSRFAELVGFDMLLLRDETTTPVHAGRMAFDGSSRPAAPDEIDEWTSALVAATSAIKRASPSTLLVLYSSGLSPTVELRYGRLDIARVVSEGMIDAWVDQTWGGAWQDWWDAGWQGWSFQLTNLLARAALIAEGNATRQVPCRHYPLFQLLDGWEPYDTLHDYPDKLKWGIWAFSHASVQVAGHYVAPRGAYLAVANDRTGELISSADVEWIAETLSEAHRSSSNLERVLGPLLVTSSRIDGQSASITAEAVEDAAGFLGKWGVPVLATTTSTMMGTLEPEGVIVAAPAARATAEAGPSLVVGAAEDLEPQWAAELGVAALDSIAPSGYRRGIASDTSRGLKAHAWPYMGRRHATRATSGATVIYGGEDGPTAVRSNGSLWWLPPHVANGADRRLTHYQVGTVDPHIAVAWELTQLRIDQGLIAIDPPERQATVAFHSWVSGGVLHVLLGNVESGWIGDSRFARRVRLHIPAEFLTDPAELVLGPGASVPVLEGIASLEVPPEGFLIGRLQRIMTTGAE